MSMDEERSEEERLLDDPSGGPSAKNVESPQEQDEAADPSSGAAGQEPGEGAVEDAREETDQSKPTPG